MDAKENLLQTIRIGLANGTIQTSDLTVLIAQTEPAAPAHDSIPALREVRSPGLKLSVVDVLFYLAGLVLYAALMVMASQMSGGTAPKAVLLIGAGLTFWVIAYALGRARRSENGAGVTSATLLTGSLSLISGAGVVIADLSLGADTGYAATIALVLLGVFHVLFDKLFRHMILIVLGMLLLVAAFPTVLSTMLQSMSLPLDIWGLIGVGTGLLAAFAGYVASKTAEGRQQVLESFLSIAGFVVLGSTYALTFESSRGLLWTVLFPFIVYGAFFLSIKRRSKNFLITGSLFLVLFIITVAFRYFAGFGAAFCLVLSAVGLLATAFMATAINKRYIKHDGVVPMAQQPAQATIVIDDAPAQAVPAAAAQLETTAPESTPTNDPKPDEIQADATVEPITTSTDAQPSEPNAPRADESPKQ